MKKCSAILVIMATIVFFLVVYLLTPVIETNIKLITAISILVILSSSIIYKIIKKDSKVNTKNLAIIIITIGILIRAMYIIYTPITERQHDVYSINDEGHLGYIYRIYETGKLPDTNSIQFYHPPLFHYIGARMVKDK